MKPIEVINAEQAKLKDAITEAIRSFNEATGLMVNTIDYSLIITELQCGAIYYPKMNITYISTGIELYDE